MRRIEDDDSYLPMTESDLATRVKLLAHANGWIVFSLPANRTVRPVKDAIGYPDMTCARDGECVFLELKQERGELTVEQRLWLAALPAAHVIRPSDWYSGRVAELLA